MVNKSSVKPFIFCSDKLNFKTLMGAKGKEYWIEGYITTGDLDLVNDIVTKNCMDSMMAQFDMRSIKLDFEHEAFRGDTELDAEAAKTRLVLGKAMTQNRDSKGVKIGWQLNPTWKKFDEKGNIVMSFSELWQNVEDEYYDAYSIAYVPTKTAMIDRSGLTIRLLDDVNLLNVALTGNAINPAASMTSVMAKSLEFMKNQEQNDPNDLSLIEIKGRFNTLTDDMSKLMNTKGYKSMVEKTDAELKAEADVKAKLEAEEKSKAEAKAKADAEAKAEAESKANVDVKSRIEKLEADMKAVQEANAEMKAVLEKAQHKATGAEAKNQGQEDPKMVGPLDMV